MCGAVALQKNAAPVRSESTPSDFFEFTASHTSRAAQNRVSDLTCWQEWTLRSHWSPGGKYITSHLGSHGLNNTGCYQISYCNVACQGADRPRHREECLRYSSALTGPPPAPSSQTWDIPALLIAANGGSPVSQGRLAQCHANGWGGLDVNYGESFHWFDKAAQSPDAPTWVVHNYACCFLWGRGTPVDPARAVSLLLSLAQGVPGFPDSQYQLGCCYQRGQGVPYDPVQGFAWLKRAAEAGHVLAVSKVALALCRGFGVPRDTACSG